MASAPDRVDSDSDYGYDLSLEDEELLVSLADGARATDVASTASRHAAIVPRSGPRGKASLVGVARTNSVDAFVRTTQQQPLSSIVPAEDVHYPDLSGVLNSLEEEQSTLVQPTSVSPAQLPPNGDTRSPLLRFRTFPKKPFSVSDLTAGAWCELQYEYTLTRLPRGKKTRTVAMKEGSKVHQKLEDEVHTTVQVQVATKEDAFGLKLWNIIQGLRTLRDTGLTRELEVWGLVDGNVVNGLIDFLSYENPSPEFEEEWLSSHGSQSGAGGASQKSITNFFPSDRPKVNRKVYLTDVKTRAVKSVPKGAAIRPTKVQLFLYHRFLSDMAEDKVDFLVVFKRYGLKADRQFSDAFLAEMGELHDDVFQDSSSVLSSSSAPSPDEDAHDLLRYRTLEALVPLLRSELKLTFPAGAESIGSVVTVEYRMRGGEGALIGTNIVAVDTEVLDQYLEGYLQWWRGERPAEGVEIEEAYKCSYCEFAEVCTWREEIDRTNLKRARAKTLARGGDGDGDGDGRPAAVTTSTTSTSKSPRPRRRKSASPA